MSLNKPVLWGVLFATAAAAGGWVLRSIAQDLTITTYYPSPYGVYDQLRTRGNTFLALTPASRVAVGTASADTKLHVEGTVKIVDGTQGAGKVLTSDAFGQASWQAGSNVPCNWTGWSTCAGNCSSSRGSCSGNYWTVQFFCDNGRLTNSRQANCPLY